MQMTIESSVNRQQTTAFVFRCMYERSMIMQRPYIFYVLIIVQSAVITQVYRGQGVAHVSSLGPCESFVYVGYTATQV